jgi:hypothetical protein
LTTGPWPRFCLPAHARNGHLSYVALYNVNDQILDFHSAEISFGVGLRSFFSFHFKSGGRLLALFSCRHNAIRSRCLPEIRRKASTYGAANGSVVGWIMNLARSKAIDHLRFDQRKKRVNTYPHGLLTDEETARKLSQPLGIVKTRIRSGLRKLREALGRE